MRLYVVSVDLKQVHKYLCKYLNIFTMFLTVKESPFTTLIDLSVESGLSCYIVSVVFSNYNLWFVILGLVWSNFLHKLN